MNNEGTLLPDLHALLKTDERARLGPETRASALPLELLKARLDQIFKNNDVAPASMGLFRAVTYLWHDHLEASHQIAQALENRDGSLVHGMMHRREPDYSNAKYWFRRVGTHPSYLSLATRAGEFLEKRGETGLHSRLLPNKMWDPFAFVDAAEDAASGQFRSKQEILEEVQKLEFECLMENLVNRA